MPGPGKKPNGPVKSAILWWLAGQKEKAAKPPKPKKR